MDAAIYNANTKTYYFFKGAQQVAIKNGVAGEPTPIGRNQPTDMDAAHWNALNDTYYFFKDDKVYKRKGGNDTEAGEGYIPKSEDGWMNTKDVMPLGGSAYTKTNPSYIFTTDDGMYTRARGKRST